MPRRSRRRVVVVSNRGPYRTVTSSGKKQRVRAAGGLVAALDPVLRGRGGVWVSADEHDASETPNGSRGSYELVHVPLTRSVREGYYEGVSNALLWPILHSLAPTVRFGSQQWEAYETANAAFCDRVVKASRSTDLIWVQDFHLTLLPRMVRKRRSRARIGWFCHIPWPGHDFFEILPWRREILDGLLGADLLGFHTEGYADNFLDCIDSLVPEARVDYARKTVRLDDRTIRVTVAPIGIPIDEIQTLAADPEVTAEVERIQRWVDNRRIVLGVDRLDYTKGIPHRIRAFEQLLRSERAARNRYVLVQIMVPSRTDVRAYADLKTEVDRLVGDINGRYSSAGRVPIQYFYRNLAPTHLYAHYRAADVALVTPLRDGMNLVALEFAACRIHSDGVLVLSEFAGAAQYLREALLVNPYDIQGMSRTLREALDMPPEEAVPRMHRLRAQVHKLDVHRWADDYLDQLEKL